MNKKLRTDILARDNHMCQKCGYPNKYWLEIHHIDKNPRNNNPSNLITFCKQCHLEEHNRDIHRYNSCMGYFEKLKGSEEGFKHFWNSDMSREEMWILKKLQKRKRGLPFR